MGYRSDMSIGSSQLPTKKNNCLRVLVHVSNRHTYTPPNECRIWVNRLVEVMCIPIYKQKPSKINVHTNIDFSIY